MDSRHEQIKQYMSNNKVYKSLDSIGSGTLLQPQFLQETIGEVIQIHPSIYAMLPKFDAPGGVYSYLNWNIEPLGVPQGATYPDSPTVSMANTDPLTTRNTVYTSIILAPFQVSKFEAASVAGELDVVARRIDSGMKDFHRREELFYLSGDTQNSTQPGLLATLSASGNISAGTVAGGNGQTLSYGLFNNIEGAQEDMGYSIDVWVVTKNIYSILSNAAFNRVRFLGLQEMQIGYSQNTQKQVLALNGKPVVRSHYLYSAAGNADTILGLSLDPDAIGVASLQMPEVEELARLPLQPLTRSFCISAFEALVVKEPYMHAIATNVVTAGVVPSSFD
jgi:hypothetical protein